MADVPTFQPDCPAVNDMSDVSPVLFNSARVYRCQEIIDNGRFSNIRELAETTGIESGAVAKAIRPAWLPSRIVHKIITGKQELTMSELRESIPALWSDQEKHFSDNKPSNTWRLCVKTKPFFCYPDREQQRRNRINDGYASLQLTCFSGTLLPTSCSQVMFII